MPASAVILGLGSFGGGLGAAKHLVRQGHDVLITDLRPADQLKDSINALKPEIDAGAISLRLGEHNVSDVTTCKLLVVTPAIRKPWDNRFVRAAQAAGVRLTTEIALTLEALPDSVHRIGITGSAGKSTTSAMIHAGIAASGRSAHLGGNIGGSLLNQVDNIGSEDAVVIELSSAQLWWLNQPRVLETKRWLDVGVVTNLAENHLDWHGQFSHYAESKHILTQRLTPAAVAVLGRTVQDFPTPARRAELVDADSIPPLAIPGEHNRTNACLALTACIQTGVDKQQAADGIAGFQGLPHRLAFVREHRGVRYFNDSKSTTPEATTLACQAFRGQRIHLVVGGSDKGADLTPIAELQSSTCSLYCIGSTGDTIARLASVEPATSLEQAVAQASSLATPGDIVLLSPGCASFDQFDSFESRGNRFIELVHSLS